MGGTREKKKTIKTKLKAGNGDPEELMVKLDPLQQIQ